MCWGFVVVVHFFSYFKIVVIVPLVCISLECVSQQGLP